MTQPIVITLNGSTNVIAEKMPVEIDGSGYVKQYDGAGNIIAVAKTTKTATAGNIGGIVFGLETLPAAAATYEPGAKLGFTTTGVVAYASGTVAGIVAEPSQKIISTTYSTTDLLEVFLDVKN